VVSRRELIERRIIDFFWMKLEIDPLVESHRPNFLNVTRTRSERQAIQRLNYLLVCRELAVIEASRCAFLRGCCSSKRAKQDRGANEVVHPHVCTRLTLKVDARPGPALTD